MMMPTGDPMVFEWRTPATISARIGLDLHAPAAAVPLLAAPKLAVDGVDGNWHSGRQSGQRGYKALAVGLTRGLESQHAENLC